VKVKSLDSLGRKLLGGDVDFMTLTLRSLKRVGTDVDAGIAGGTRIGGEILEVDLYFLVDSTGQVEQRVCLHSGQRSIHVTIPDEQ